MHCCCYETWQKEKKNGFLRMKRENKYGGRNAVGNWQLIVQNYGCLSFYKQIQSPSLEIEKGATHFENDYPSFYRDYKCFENTYTIFYRYYRCFESDYLSFCRDYRCFENDYSSFYRYCRSFENDYLIFYRYCRSFEYDYSIFYRYCRSFENGYPSFCNCNCFYLNFYRVYSTINQ